MLMKNLGTIGSNPEKELKYKSYKQIEGLKRAIPDTLLDGTVT